METKVWLPIAISSLSLVVSGFTLFISFWRGRYRLKISSAIATLVTEAEDPQNVVIVEVVNNGGESAEVSDVFLKPAEGPGRALTIRLSSPGPALPVTLAARGGRESWYFGYDELKQQARNRLPDTPLTVRATVRVGSRNHSERGELVISPTDELPDPQLSGRQKWSRWWQSWTRPTARIQDATFTPDQLAKQTCGLIIENTDEGPLLETKLELLVRHASGQYDRAVGYETVAVPLIWGGGLKRIEVPIVDDSAAVDGDQFFWRLMPRRGASDVRIAAITKTEAPNRVVQ